MLPYFSEVMMKINKIWKGYDQQYFCDFISSELVTKIET